MRGAVAALWALVVRALRLVVNFFLWNWDDDAAAARRTKKALQGRHTLPTTDQRVSAPEPRSVATSDQPLLSPSSQLRKRKRNDPDAPVPTDLDDMPPAHHDAPRYPLQTSHELQNNNPIRHNYHRSPIRTNTSTDDIIDTEDNDSAVHWSTLVGKMLPDDILQREVTFGRYQDAHECATQLLLSHDTVYKAQWLSGPVSDIRIQSYLAKIDDLDWVLNACLNTIASGPSDARTLLRYGLKLTDSISLSDVEDEISSVLDILDGKKPVRDVNNHQHHHRTKQVSVSRLCYYRLKFIKYLGRLETHRAIYADVYNSSSRDDFFVSTFEEFKDMDLLLLATQFAVKGQHSALNHLFKRHGDELLPFRLSIISLLPNTLDPTVYRRLLPAVQPRTMIEIPLQVIPWARKDWCETDEIREFAGIRRNKADTLAHYERLKVESTSVGSSYLVPDSPFMEYIRKEVLYWAFVEGTEVKLLVQLKDDPYAVLSHATVNTYGLEMRPMPLSVRDIHQWYIDRAMEIDRESGMLVRAVDLLRVGRSNNVPGLDHVYATFKVLALILYECNLMPTIDKELDVLDFETFATVEPKAFLEIQFRRVMLDEVKSRMERVLTPYIQVLVTRIKAEGHSTQEAIHIVENIVADFVVSVVDEGRIELCLKMLECISMANSGYENVTSGILGNGSKRQHAGDNDWNGREMKIDTSVQSYAPGGDRNIVQPKRQEPQLITLFANFNSFCKLVLRCAYSNANHLSNIGQLQEFVNLMPTLAQQVPSAPRVATHMIPNRSP